jgi:hypothetical protein
VLSTVVKKQQRERSIVEELHVSTIVEAWRVGGARAHQSVDFHRDPTGL